MTIVEEYAPGKFRPFEGGRCMKRHHTAQLVYADGRQEEKEVKPYDVPVNVSKTSLVNRSDAELAELRLYRVAPFVPPRGKVAAGTSRYERRGGKVVEVRDVQDAKPEQPATPEEKLARLGLTREDIRKLVRD